MRKAILFFIFFYGCVTMGIRGSGDYLYNPDLKKDVENHGFEFPEEKGVGFLFGIGFFHPDYFLIRGKFSQMNLKSSDVSLYTQEGWVEGGVPVLKNRFFAFYPIVGFGAENQVVKLNQKFEGTTYGVLLGFENHLILTRQKPGYLGLVFGANVKRIGGTFLDATGDFLISPSHTKFQVFIGVEMGYIYER